MKHILTMLLCLLTIGAGAQIYEKGVSKTLADYRTRTISDVSYDLTFNIPATQKERVHGTAIISFFLQEKAVVVLDFQGRFSGACLVNGKKRVAGMKNEHIIIPLKMTKKGLNSIEMNFVCQDKALNRHGDYAYTQFAPGQAQQCFPCFDQPDLRAKFTTQMNVPKGWKTTVCDGRIPIPTSLYSFVTGRFEEIQQQTREGYKICVLHREQTPEKVKQLPKIIEETSQSLRWMESYTGVKFPFEEFGMVILPDYQPGGMELPGAMLLSDKHLFLSEKPSHHEQLRRWELIAHETAHQWFGGIVTLKQAEEAWTKEVLVNFMASKMTRQQLSKNDYDLNFLSTYQARAVDVDRQESTHPIAQRQDKPDHTTKFFDDIIYDKAPVMMRILEDIIGQKQLQAALQQYIRDFYYKSASWDDLVAIIDRQAPQAGVRQFSDVWVKQKGMPVIHISYRDGQLVVSQTDPYGRGLFWRQKFDIRLIYDLDHSRTVTIDMTQPTVTMKLGRQPSSIIPNYSGRGYGRFTLDDPYTQKLPLRLIVTRGDLNRYALMLTLHDNYLMGRIPPSYFGELYRDMTKEKNPLIMETGISHMINISANMPRNERQTLEQCIMDLLRENRRPEFQQTVVRQMNQRATSPQVKEQLRQIMQTTK